MKKTYTVAGIGVCLGKAAGCKALAESILTGTPISGKAQSNALNQTVKEALRFTSINYIPVLTNAALEHYQLTQMNLGGQQTCGSLAEMLEKAGDTALLLSKQENGWMAIALTQEETGLAHVEITSIPKENTAIAEDFLSFLTTTIELRYALHLGPETAMYRFWDSMEPRSKEITCGGCKLLFTEPKQLASVVYEANQYLLPVVFTTVEEAKQKLADLKEAAQTGMYVAMQGQLATLAQRNENTNTIVLLAENAEILASEIDELLKQADQLQKEGFTWHSKNGSAYIRRSCADPKVVFMNPPGGMFHAKVFYQFFFKFYSTLTEASRFETDSLLLGAEEYFLSKALFDMVVNYTVTTLLEHLGIRADIMSGASMGELSMEFPHIKDASGKTCDIQDIIATVADPIRPTMQGDKELLETYLGRPISCFTKYYLKCDLNQVRETVKKYDSVFICIAGSVEDVMVAGERTACLKLIEELACVATEMTDSIYIHTPIMEAYRGELQRNIRNAGLYLDVEHLPFKLFSTFYRDYMTSDPEMLASNTTNLIVKEVDYAAAVDALYQNGARVFIDLSTMQLCGTWAQATLRNRKDANVVSIYSGKDAASDLCDLAVAMLAGNVRFDHETLLSRLKFRTDTETKPRAMKQNNIHATVQPSPTPVSATATQPNGALHQLLQRQLLNNQNAFKRFMEAQNKLYTQMLDGMASASAAPAQPAGSAAFPYASKEYLYNREQVITMTDTSMAAVLGKQYEPVDQYPIRARMPLPPFLFVSRILSIDAEFGVLNPGSIVAEYDFDTDCVFRNSDSTISVLVAAEASHIGIYLMGYMGLDVMSNGTLSFRALDCAQTYLSDRLFRVGDTMKTVFTIDRFAQNGATTIMFYHYETYNNGVLVSKSEASGGFFTKAELQSNKGVVVPKRRFQTQLEPKPLLRYTNEAVRTFNQTQVEAFYQGDYNACFGHPIPNHLVEQYYLPFDMRMIDTITDIDDGGGKYGRGFISGEKQITPDLWPFQVHFKNDPVFPGIIMIDGANQIAMFLLAHMGALGRFENAIVSMVLNGRVKTQFRGQVRKGYSNLRYEIHVKDSYETDTGIYLSMDVAIFNEDIQVIQMENFDIKVTEVEALA